MAAARDPMTEQTAAERLGEQFVGDLTAKLEQVTRSMSYQRKVIASCAEELKNADRLGAEVRQLAELEGQYRVIDEAGAIARWLASGKGHAVKTAEELILRVRHDVMRRVLGSGADDTWSGRGNEIRRARFDGARKACDWLDSY